MANLKNVLLIIALSIPLFSSAQLTYPTKYPTAIIPHPSNGSVFFFAY